MARRRRHRGRKSHLDASASIAGRPPAIREATRVVQLVYTRAQAAQALGVSRSTFIRRVLPYVETVEMPWGGRLAPVDEVERFVAERRCGARAVPPPPARPGRKPALPAGVRARIRDERASGASFGAIARGLNADRILTSQGGRQWWPSTVRSVLIRSRSGADD
jgi:hypothetical protein